MPKRRTRRESAIDEKARQVLESLPDAFFLVDRKWKIVYFNKRAAQYSTLPVKGIVGKHIETQIPHFRGSELHKRLKAVVRTGQPERFVLYFEPHGRWYGVKAFPIENFVGIYYSDITERMRLEDAKRFYRDRLAMRLALEKAVGDLGQKALSGLPVRALMQEAVTTLARLLDAEFANVHELLPDGKTFLLRASYGWGRRIKTDRTRVDAGTQSLAGYTLLHKRPVVVKDFKSETRFSVPQFVLRHGAASALSVILYGLDRKPFGVLVVCSKREHGFDKEDIEYLKSYANIISLAIQNAQVKGALYSSHEQLNAILQTITDGVTVQNKNGTLIYANSAAAAMSGFDSAEEMVRAFSTPGKGPAKKLTTFQILAENGEPLPSERMPGRRALSGEREPHEIVQYISGNGQRMWSSIRARPVFAADGTVEMAVNVIYDLTATKEADVRKDEFIGMASHELKTPLTIIKVLGQFLAQLPEFSKGAPLAYLEKMNTQVDRLSKLLGDMLDISKIQRGQIEFSIEDVPIDDLVRETVDLVQHTSPHHSLVVTGETDAQVRGDRERLSQVVTNLLTNAVKYSPRARKVCVNIATTGHRVRISVQDYGFGIPQSQQRRIFERFYRVAGARHDAIAGLGLGLFIAQEIVRRHGGNITVKSHTGKGSTFTLELPVIGTSKSRQSVRPAAVKSRITKRARPAGA
jgi:PAS domain S-box-containing protein